MHKSGAVLLGHDPVRLPGEIIIGKGDRLAVMVGAGPRGLHLARQHGRVARVAMGGAISASGMFVQTFKDMHDGSDLVFDFVNDTVKYALFSNTVTPNFSADTAYGASPYNANEASGTGYTAGGVTTASKTLTESPTGTLAYDFADPAWGPGATFGPVRGGLIWDDTVTTPVADCVIGLHAFGADFSVTSGTLTVVIASAGAFTDDLA